MTQSHTEPSGSSRLIVLIKSAYWVGLAIIAAITMTSYVMMRQLMSDQQSYTAASQITGEQMALSQRFVTLSRAINSSYGDQQLQFSADLATTVTQFAQNYRSLKHHFSGRADRALADVLNAPGSSLQALTNQLTESAGQLFNQAWVSQSVNSAIDRDDANRIYAAYADFGRMIEEQSKVRLANVLAVHRTLYYSTIIAILLVALFIFRPMSNAILRRNDELVDARNSMAFIASHDGLTGLYNRAFLADHFDALLKSAHRRRERIAVVQLDLDRFKQINDTLGHAAGDFVLIAAAQRMQAACRGSDICVRLGGDEFVAILSAAGTTDDINAVTRRILARINDPIIYKGVTIMPGASAGVAVYPVDADTSEDLLIHADLALYAAKKNGGGAASFFSEELRRELEQRRAMEADIKAAIEAEAFVPHFQPQVAMSANRIIGVEALVRWPHPVRGMVSPAEFLTLAEKAGLMPAVGRIVMRKAIEAAATWERQGIRFGRLALNVSGTELRENDFADFLFQTLDRCALPYERLSLEIVESVILDDDKTGIATKLRMIRAAGIHLELDDFGTGYASLSHVSPHEIDRLKIDRRFVKDIDVNADNSKIVRAITELARGLGISIIAEGAETEAELDILRDIGCDQVQGYSVAMPMPASETREWLSRQQPASASHGIVAANVA